MAFTTLDEYLKEVNPGAVQDPGEENNETSTIASVLAGIGSGIFKIPEGFFFIRRSPNGFRRRH